MIVLLEVKKKNSSYVNTDSSNVTNRSNNTANANSGVSYLNVNNSPSNTNANRGSQLLTVDLYSVYYIYLLVLICLTLPLGKKQRIGE